MYLWPHVQHPRLEDEQYECVWQLCFVASFCLAQRRKILFFGCCLCVLWDSVCTCAHRVFRGNPGNTETLWVTQVGARYSAVKRFPCRTFPQWTTSAPLGYTELKIDCVKESGLNYFTNPQIAEAKTLYCSYFTGSQCANLFCGPTFIRFLLHDVMFKMSKTCARCCRFCRQQLFRSTEIMQIKTWRNYINSGKLLATKFLR